VDRLLSSDPHLLAINSRATASERGERNGFANLVRDKLKMFRNHTEHEARLHWSMSKEDAEDLRAIVSLIYRRLDKAHMPPRV
jgi:uncharacterized protein (TIGR02391 family)